MSTFVMNSLPKSASELEKMKKKIDFFDFLKMILDFRYDHYRLTNLSIPPVLHGVLVRFLRITPIEDSES